MERRGAGDDADADVAVDKSGVVAVGEGNQRQRGGGNEAGRRKQGVAQDGGGDQQARNVFISKALARLLRHKASGAGIALDSEGYAAMDRVLAWGPLKSLKPTWQEMQQIVCDDVKQRFAIKSKDGREGGGDAEDWLIRANQGHSIKVESEGLLTPLALAPDEGATTRSNPPPSTVVHGTFLCFWNAIESSGGLKPMGRRHVHFSTGLPSSASGVISGMRRDAELLIYVDMELCMREAPQIKWWISANGVVLTEGDPDKDGLVPSRYFKRVESNKSESMGGVGVLWRDGERVKELQQPGGLSKARRGPPRGKEFLLRRQQGQQ